LGAKVHSRGRASKQASERGATYEVELTIAVQVVRLEAALHLLLGDGVA
jgi:hypothetical protein